MRRIAGLGLALLLILGAAVPAAARQNSKHDHHNSTLFATGQLGTALLAIDVERGTTKVIGPTGQHRTHRPAGLYRVGDHPKWESRIQHRQRGDRLPAGDRWRQCTTGQNRPGNGRGDSLGKTHGRQLKHHGDDACA